MVDNTSSTPLTAKKYKFLSGGGEMGMLTRTKDWANTALGDPANWPQSLKTTIGIILHSKFPMFIFWGPELICFYNDAYRPSLGQNGKHPHILGMPGAAAWPEIWDIIKPLIDQVLGGGDATWSEDQLIPIFRNGKIEDVYWTFSYSPINDDSGTVAGILVTCTETTDKILTYKKLEENKNQLQFAIDAAEMATWDIDPAAGTFTGDERLRNWLGLITGDQFDLEHNGFAAVVEKYRERLRNELTRALDFSSGGILDIEFEIQSPVTNTIRYVRAKGKAFFNEHKIAYSINGILQDVTTQVIARQKIEEVDKRFRNTVRQAPIGITILRGPDFFVEMANDAYLELVDRKERDFVNKPLFDSLPEVKQTVLPLLNEVLQTGNPFHGIEYPIPINRFGKHGISYFNFLYHPLRENNGDISGIIVTVTDVTESVKAKHLLAESENQFRNMVMQSPIPMTILRGKDFVIETANRVMFETIWRKKDTDIIGRPILEVFPELRQQKYEELLNEVFSTGKIHREKESIAYVQGDDDLKKFYLDFEYAPLFEKDNTVSGIIITVNDVTEKVEARIIVEESELRFRNVANSAPVFIWTADTNKMRNFFNTAWLKFTGRTLEQEKGNGWSEGVHPDDFERCINYYMESFDKRQEFYFEYRLRRHDGEYRWVSAKAVPRFTATGVFEGYIGACMDIHERVVYQEKLKEDEERLNIIIKASELGTWELNLKEKTLNYSDRYLEILGYAERVDLTHEELLSHLHPGDMHIRDKAFKDAFSTGVLYYESRLIWKDGSIHWIEGKGKVFYNENNEPIRLVGTLRDITDEKNHQQELIDSERKFRLLGDSMPEFVWASDEKGNLNYFNQSIYDYSGLTPKQVEEDGWLQIVHPDERAENMRLWLHSIATGTDFIFEHRFRRYDGEYRWQLSRATPQKDGTGKIQMWVGTSTDIQELREKDQQKDLFISMASHELKTPVTSIKGFVQILQAMYADGNDSFLKSSLDTVDKQITTLTKLISELLDLSKIKSGKLLLNSEHFSLNELVQDIMDQVKHINPGYTITFNCKAPVNIYADRDRIGQVLINFLTNAIKYSPGSSEIKIESVVEGDNVVVSVEDSGIGISLKDQEKIFERFYRVEGKSEKTFPGFGIGLFIASEIIHRHKGKIGVKSEPGKGSRFYFSIPCSKLL
ncbi:PAS domain S-box protein [Ferruginibacter sp.]